MDKIKIGNLTHNRKKCNCGKTATFDIFLIKEKRLCSINVMNVCQS